MMQQQETDSHLYSELDEGERLLWSGRPNPKSRSSSSPANVFIILTIVFSLVAIAMLIIGFILLGTVHGKGSEGAYLGLFITGGTFLFLTIFFGIFAIFYKQSLSGTIYAITDQRIITITTGNTTVVSSYGRTDIGAINRFERSDGTGDLIFAPSRTSGYGGGYNYNAGAYGNNNNAYGPRTYGIMANAGKFIGISNVRDVERLIRKTFKSL